MKKICLCITNYNKEEFLDRAIRSCLSQITFDFILEVVVVNDGSKSFKAKQLSREFSQIKIINYKKNYGVAYASNKALFFTKADYFMRVDADDFISMKSCLILSNFLDENPNIPFIFGDILLIEKNKKIKLLRRNNRKTLLNNGAGIMFRTQYLKKIKGYDIKLKNCEDFDLIIRLEKKFGKGYYIPIAYYKYYQTNKIHLSKSKNRRHFFERIKKKYENQLN